MNSRKWMFWIVFGIILAGVIARVYLGSGSNSLTFSSAVFYALVYFVIALAIHFFYKSKFGKIKV